MAEDSKKIQSKTLTFFGHHTHTQNVIPSLANPPGRDKNASYGVGTRNVYVHMESTILTKP